MTIFRDADTDLGHSNAPARDRAATTRTPIDPQRLRRVKKSYTTRYTAASLEASPSGHHLLAGTEVTPREGDLVVARVTEIGKHTRLEGPGSRRQLLFPGDEVLLAYGHRYAPDQFLAEVPADLGRCHLVAAGGLAGTVTAMHASIDEPTAIEPLGLLADEAGVVRLERHAPLAVTPQTWARSAPGPRADGPLVVAVLGTSMNSGKSTTLACLVNGLTAAGLVVSAGKATGTGAGNDAHLFRDAGATRVLDFTDFGLPSTFRLDAEQVLDVFGSLVAALAEDGPDVVVVEIADGVYQGETSRLLADPAFGSRIDHVVFAAQDALGAAAGVTELRRHGLPVAGVSGVLTASPLAAAEARAALDVEVTDTYELCRPAVATALVPRG
ncbi:hypothetical protein [Nocardioides nanhaiensis]|uniref:DUF1611 domain-containing protein n=1 Tax=Nocardioides nanhaiensis TaxID=1476871 RepID=A0ABP8W5C6_9ACTN